MEAVMEETDDAPSFREFVNAMEDKLDETYPVLGNPGVTLEFTDGQNDCAFVSFEIHDKWIDSEHVRSMLAGSADECWFEFEWIEDDTLKIS